MVQKAISIRVVVATGIGTAIFFVLMRFAALPSGVPNTNLSMAAAVLAFFAAVFGPLAGFFIGFIGHTLTDLTLGGVWWSWVIANAVCGLFTGLFWKLYKIEAGSWSMKNCLLFNLLQILANIIAWVGIAPSLDILIYSEPAEKVYLQGLAAAGMNSAVVFVLGSLFAFGYSHARVKGSQKAKK